KRPSLVVDGLTVLRAYHLSKRANKLWPIGSFEDWSKTVREALVWMCDADPAETREALRAGDPKKEALVEVLSLWEECFQARPTPVSIVAAGWKEEHSGTPLRRLFDA